METKTISESLSVIARQGKEELTLGRQPLVRYFTNESVGPMGPTDFDTFAKADQIYRFIVGKDHQKPEVMSKEEIEQWLCDSFAGLILERGQFPLTLNRLVEEFEKTKEMEKGLKAVFVYHVAEGGQIPWSETTEKVSRTFRLVVNIQVKGGIGADVLISTGINNDSEKQFLQLMSWDPINRAFNFYQRLGPFWIWSGNSFHALESETRNKGPFSGHVNGGPVMKELKLPWPHWSSMSAVISKTIFPPDHPFIKTRFFTDEQIIRGGERFESLVRSAISLWNTSRVTKAIGNGKVEEPIKFLRQILDTTNLNLTSSPIPSISVSGNTEILLPFSFFANVEAFSVLGITPEINGIVVSGELYLQNLKEFEFNLESDDTKIPGDTHFAFLIPEPAAEDIDLLKKMTQKGIISKRLAACLLMVDFSNPIFSPFRALLQRYVPDEILVGNNGKDLEEKFVSNVINSGKHLVSETPENEFFMNWDVGEEKWIEEFGKRIADYFLKIQVKVNTKEGYDQIIQLAESRRESFKQLPLYEFPLTFATTNVPFELFPLEITPDGIIHKQKLS